MKIVFFGSGKFGLPSLQALSDAGHAVACVVSQPDRNKGRGMKPACTPIKECALALGIPVLQPEKINSPQAKEALKALNAEIFVVIAYGQLLPSDILAIPSVYAINLHASLLPKYRGAAPINWALIQGEPTTGVSVIRMSARMDAGPVLNARAIPIRAEDTAITLGETLSRSGAELLLETLQRISDGSVEARAQREEEASFAPKLSKAHGLIDWQKSAASVLDLVRGCSGWPQAFTYIGEKSLKVHKARVEPVASGGRAAYPGEILHASKEGLIVACGEGALRIEEIQLEGKKRMSVAEFMAGHKVCEGDILKPTK